MRTKENIIYTVLLIIGIALIFIIFKYMSIASYKISYEKHVKHTIIEMVKKESLK